MPYLNHHQDSLPQDNCWQHSTHSEAGPHLSAATGVVGSRVMYTYWDTLREFIADDKILIFGLGLACGFTGFVLAVRFIKTADRKAQDIVDGITARWDKKYLPPREDPPTDKITHASTRRK